MSPHGNRPLRSETRATQQTKGRARELRVSDTPPEKVLWSRLRGKQINGLKFRRQHPIGPYIADFYCHDASLVIEIDSRFHLDQQHADHDLARDRWMRQRGIEVVRVSASQVATDLDGTLRMIARTAHSRLNQPPPSRSA